MVKGEGTDRTQVLQTFFCYALDRHGCGPQAVAMFRYHFYVAQLELAEREMQAMHKSKHHKNESGMTGANSMMHISDVSLFQLVGNFAGRALVSVGEEQPCSVPVDQLQNANKYLERRIDQICAIDLQDGWSVSLFSFDAYSPCTLTPPFPMCCRHQALQNPQHSSAQGNPCNGRAVSQLRPRHE